MRLHACLLSAVGCAALFDAASSATTADEVVDRRRSDAFFRAAAAAASGNVEPRQRSENATTASASSSFALDLDSVKPCDCPGYFLLVPKERSGRPADCPPCVPSPEKYRRSLLERRRSLEEKARRTMEEYVAKGHVVWRNRRGFALMGGGGRRRSLQLDDHEEVPRVGAATEEEAEVAAAVATVTAFNVNTNEYVGGESTPPCGCPPDPEAPEMEYGYFPDKSQAEGPVSCPEVIPDGKCDPGIPMDLQMVVCPPCYGNIMWTYQTAVRPGSECRDECDELEFAPPFLPAVTYINNVNVGDDPPPGPCLCMEKIPDGEDKMFYEGYADKSLKTCFQQQGFGKKCAPAASTSMSAAPKDRGDFPGKKCDCEEGQTRAGENDCGTCTEIPPDPRAPEMMPMRSSPDGPMPVAEGGTLYFTTAFSAPEECPDDVDGLDVGVVYNTNPPPPCDECRKFAGRNSASCPNEGWDVTYTLGSHGVVTVSTCPGTVTVTFPSAVPFTQEERNFFLSTSSKVLSTSPHALSVGSLDKLVIDSGVYLDAYGGAFPISFTYPGNPAPSGSSPDPLVPPTNICFDTDDGAPTQTP